MTSRCSKTIVAATSMLAALASFPAAARADIIFDTGVNNQGTANILLADAFEQATIIGTVNTGAFEVAFTSAGGNLNAVASGQARITPGAANNPFSNILFSIVGGAAFTRAVFNLNADTGGDLIIRVTEDNGTVTNLATTVNANGQNFFTVDAINGQQIASIELLGGAGVDFEDLRQVRIGGVGGVVIPEPSLLFLVAAGLLGAAGRARRRTR